MGRRRLLRVPELSLQECVVGTALFKMDNQQGVTFSTGNSAQLYDSLDRRGVLGTRIPGYTWLSPYCPPETQNIVNELYSNTKNFLNKVWIVGMQEENQHSLQRKQGAGVKRKETGSEGNYGHTCSFLIILKCG